ncbi:MAG: hypothetical protein ABEJ90_00210 [Halobacterium sp.]
MYRRRLLALAGLAAGGSGCLDSAPDGDAPARSTPAGGTGDATERAPTTTPPGTRTPATRRTLASNEPYRTARGWTLRVRTYRVRRGVLAHRPDGFAVSVPEGRQYLQVGVETSGAGAPPPRDLRLAAAVDGQLPFGPRTSVLEAVPADRLGTVQAVPVPVPFSGRSVSLRWTPPDQPPVEWAVSDRLTDRLAVRPDLRASLDAPEQTAGDRIPVTLTVGNDGRRDDWLVARLALAGAAERPVELAVGAGETRTVERTLPAAFGDDGRATVVLDWGLDAVRRTVERA